MEGSEGGCRWERGGCRREGRVLDADGKGMREDVGRVALHLHAFESVDLGGPRRRLLVYEAELPWVTIRVRTRVSVWLAARVG